MLKKFLAVLIGIVLFISVTITSSIYVVQNFISKDNLSTILNNYMDEMIEENDFFKESDDIVSEYLDNDEFKDIISSLVAEYLVYNTGLDTSSKPSTDELKNYMEDLYDKIEKENDITLDRSTINEGIAVVEEIFDKEIVSQENKETITDFTEFISKDILIGCYVVDAVCIILIFILRGRNLFNHLARIAIINSLIMFSIGSSSKFLVESFDTEGTTQTVIDSLTGLFNKVGIISLIAGIIFIVVIIILKLTKKKEVNYNGSLNNDYEDNQTLNYDVNNQEDINNNKSSKK